MPSFRPNLTSVSTQSNPPSLRRNSAANRTNSSSNQSDATERSGNITSISTASSKKYPKSCNNNWGTVGTETTPVWGSPRSHHLEYDNSGWGEEPPPQQQVSNPPSNDRVTTSKRTTRWESPQSHHSKYKSSWGNDSESPSPPKSSEPCLNDSVTTPKYTPMRGSRPPYRLKYENSRWGDDSEPLRGWRPQPPRAYFHRRPDNLLPKIDQPCDLWLENKCNKGDGCRYVHDPEAQKKHLYVMGLLNHYEIRREINNVKEHVEADRLSKFQQMKLKEEAIKQDALATIQQLILGCALVTCSAGLKVREIICGFESCRLRIKQLPRDANNQEIVALFSRQGIEPSQYFLKYVRPVHDHRYLEAEVITTVQTGDIMLDALNSLSFRNEILRCEKLQAGEMDLCPQAIESINLSISCKAPTSCAIAIYRSMQDVENAIKEKHGSIFHDYHIKVEKNIPPTGPALQSYNPQSVRVLGLPLNVSLKEVRQYMQASSVKPLKRPIYNFDEFYENLTTHLTYSSRVKMKAILLKPSEPQDQGRKQMEVKFDTWQDAKDAMDYLSEKKIKPNYPRLYFRIPARFRFFSSIPISQYHAQELRWKALSEDVTRMKKESESTTETELSIRFGTSRVFVNLHGNDCKAVGALKVKVENLVKGDKLAEAYWHHNFCTMTGREFLESVSKLTKTWLISDWRLKALKIYYDCEQGRDRALQLVKEEVERLSSLEWTVILDSQMVKFFISTGLKIAKEELGEDALSLDLFSRPQKLVVKATHAGQFSTQQTVDRLIEMAINQSSTPTTLRASSSAIICPICYDKPTLPIELGCGHNYCLSCFRHYLVSVPETKTFPLFCMGDEGNCKTPIPIPTIRKHLTQLQFDRLIEIAFFTYIEKNPNKIRYCPTPDCPQVYMCSSSSATEEREGKRGIGERERGENNNSNSKFQQCPSCLMSICTACHDEAHAGITCAEMRLFKDPTEQERRNEVWAQENGVKRCPRCSVWIMKAEGCDHMTCHCGAHICWRCMGVFPVSEIYEHIGTLHNNDFY